MTTVRVVDLMRALADLPPGSDQLHIAVINEPSGTMKCLHPRGGREEHPAVGIVLYDPKTLSMFRFVPIENPRQSLRISEVPGTSEVPA